MIPLLAALAFQKGIALGLFAEDPDFDYAPMLREIAQTGATHVSLTVAAYQHDLRSTEIAAHPRFTPPDEAVVRAMAAARAANLRVLLCPILRLETAASPADWRGSIVPADRAAWWRSYDRLLLHYAAIAARGGAESLCLGSELSNMDGERERWASLARRVRAVFGGRLVYSANWDRFAKVALWDLVDEAGLSAYFELTAGERDPSADDLVVVWRDFRVEATRARARAAPGKPLVLTEVGYLSQDGTAHRPWNESALEAIDLEEQRRCYEAVRRVWDGAPDLGGVYFWNWYGWGGPRSREYTPRGKPAAREICRWYGGAACPDAHGAPWRAW